MENDENYSAARVILEQLSETQSNTTVFDSIDTTVDECNNLLVPCYGETVEISCTTNELDPGTLPEQIVC